jgi:hypothetical protein
MKPHHRKIYNIIATRGPVSQKELGAITGLANSAVCRTTGTLLETGRITAEKMGQVRYYTAQPLADTLQDIPAIPLVRQAIEKRHVLHSVWSQA